MRCGGRALWLTLAACSTPAPHPSAVDAGPAVLVVSAPHDDLPPRTAFAGSESCRDCHSAQYDGWKRDWHARALSEPAPATVVGRFDNAHFKGASSEATMLRKQGRYLMRTSDSDGIVADREVNYLVGGKRMQDALTALDDGRWQVLPVYFHVTGRGEWVDYNEAKQGVTGPAHPFYWQNFRRTANRECLGCHATGVSLSYARKENRWTTAMAEPGVGCEACHGPGARHSESKSRNDIASLKTFDASQKNAVCASCHGPREPLYSLLDPAHRFLPGAQYGAHFQPAGLVDGDTRSGEYFADGRPSSSSFEWQALQQSKCFMKSKQLSCLTCHTAPHAEHGLNELPKDASPDASCVACHEAQRQNIAAHSHHPKGEGQKCVNCHMPKVLSSVLDHFADHAIDVPVPQNTIEHGVPNACSTCHAKASLESLAKQVTAWWPSQSWQRRRLTLAGAFDEKTKRSSLDALEKVVTDQDEAPLLRGFAAELLGQRFGPRAAVVLPALLESDDAYLRSRVLAGLSAARAKATAIEPVATRLVDSSVVVREFSAMLLTSWGDSRGPAALQKLAGDPATRDLVRPHLALAQRAAAAKQFEAARREVEAALALMPYSASALLLEADLAMQRHDPEAAKKSLEACLRFDPANPGAARRLSALNAKQAPEPARHQ